MAVEANNFATMIQKCLALFPFYGDQFGIMKLYFTVTL